MTGAATTLGGVCSAHLLHTKWLLAPSHRVGHQWIESLVRGGQSVVNLHPTTVLRLALDLVGAELAANGLTLVGRGAGPLVVDATWGELPPSGYLGRLEQSPDLSAAISDSLLSLRLAGTNVDDLDDSQLENAAKAEDIKVLRKAYEAFLKAHDLVDEADVLARAIARLKSDPNAVDSETLVLVPEGFHVTGLERQFLEALPAEHRIEISHPADWSAANGTKSDVRLLASIGTSAEATPSKGDGSVRFFRAVGEVNEVREVLRRCLSDKQPLDDVEVLHTDAETYVPLIYATARRYFSEPDRPEGVPVTFAEGIPASLSRPGRALVGWLRWIDEGYPPAAARRDGRRGTARLW